MGARFGLGHILFYNYTSRSFILFFYLYFLYIYIHIAKLLLYEYVRTGMRYEYECILFFKVENYLNILLTLEKQ